MRRVYSCRPYPPQCSNERALWAKGGPDCTERDRTPSLEAKAPLPFQIFHQPWPMQARFSVLSSPRNPKYLNPSFPERIETESESREKKEISLSNARFIQEKRFDDTQTREICIHGHTDLYSAVLIRWRLLYRSIVCPSPESGPLHPLPSSISRFHAKKMGRGGSAHAPGRNSATHSTSNCPRIAHPRGGRYCIKQESQREKTSSSSGSANACGRAHRHTHTRTLKHTLDFRFFPIPRPKKKPREIRGIKQGKAKLASSAKANSRAALWMHFMFGCAELLHVKEKQAAKKPRSIRGAILAAALSVMSPFGVFCSRPLRFRSFRVR
jgi:hypothetical protein